MPAVRPASSWDLPAILEIYNEAVRTTTATFDLEPRTPEAHRAWFEAHGPRHPVLVTEEGGVVIAWASLSPWSLRPAYAGTVEDSVYVAEGHRGRGVGRLLLQALVAEAVKAGHHSLVGRVCTESAASIRLHEALGFRPAGVLKEAGLKFGRRLDVLNLQLLLP